MTTWPTGTVRREVLDFTGANSPDCNRWRSVDASRTDVEAVARRYRIETADVRDLL